MVRGVAVHWLRFTVVLVLGFHCHMSRYCQKGLLAAPFVLASHPLPSVLAAPGVTP